MLEVSKTPCKCEDPLLNIKALANYLNVSVSTATKLSAKRLIPALKPSKKIVLYRKSDVDNWLSRSRIESKLSAEELADSLLSTTNPKTYGITETSN